MELIWSPRFHSIAALQPSICVSKHLLSLNVADFRLESSLNCTSQLSWNRKIRAPYFVLRAINNSLSGNVVDDDDDARREQDEVIVDTPNLVTDSKTQFGRMKDTISSIPPVAILLKRNNGSNIAIGLCIAMAFLVILIRVYVVRKLRYRSSGSVADLVRRGQLRSDRRGISAPLKYEDPFNNPLVKISKGNSSVEMCGKLYRLAPVTLTEDQRAIHQKRRSRAYQWKRPTMFLKEGDSVPPDVDPDTIRWIPTNHPFATTTTDIDETLAQNNVYQKHGVPFRIQAEHEALQKKLEALQSEQKLHKLVIDPSNAKDFERPFKKNSRSYESAEQPPTNGQVRNPNSIDQESSHASEETQKP